LASLITFASLVAYLTPVQAQTPDISTKHVIIDLSVIDYPRSASAPLTYIKPSLSIAPQRGLLLPGANAPTSRLYITVPKGIEKIKLREPRKKTTKPPKQVINNIIDKAYIKKPKIIRSLLPTTTATKPPAPLIPISPPTPIVAPVSVKQEPIKTSSNNSTAPLLNKESPKPPEISPPPATKSMITKTKAELAKKQRAALPLVKKTLNVDKSIRVKFSSKESKLPIKAKKGLRVLAKKLKGENNLRLQLMAYAGGNSLSASKARRLSLARALSVRSFLIESGVKSTHIDVRALGSKTTEKPLNRVDVNIVER